MGTTSPPGFNSLLIRTAFYCRCDSDKPGAKKICFRPDDESFAREIICEIVEGTPLQ